MIQFGHGRPLGALALGVLASLAFAPAAQAQDPEGNVVTALVPRPAADEVTLLAFRVEMDRSASHAVRRASGALPSGYGVTAVRARRSGRHVLVRLAAVRTGPAANGPAMRVRLRIGSGGDHFVRARTRATRIRPGLAVWRGGDCRTIGREANGWTSVSGLRSVLIDGDRFSARTAVGAGMETACHREVPAVSQRLADQFLGSVDEDYLVEAGGEIEGFYATWTKNSDGSGKVCVYVRGDLGGSGDLDISGTRKPFTLDDRRGLARVDTTLAPGEYEFTVRWRQPNGSFRESGSTIRVPAGAVNGQGAPEPYSTAGPCAAS